MSQLPDDKFHKQQYPLWLGGQQAQGLDRRSLQSFTAADKASVVAFTKLNADQPGTEIRPVPTSGGNSKKVACTGNYARMSVPRALYRLTSLLGDKPTYWPGTGNGPVELVSAPAGSAADQVTQLNVVANIDGYEWLPDEQSFVSEPTPTFGLGATKLAGCVQGRPCQQVVMADVATKQYVAFAFHYAEVEEYREPVHALALKYGLELPENDGPLYLLSTMVEDVVSKGLQIIYLPLLRQEDRERTHALITTTANDYHGASEHVLTLPLNVVGITLDPLATLHRCP